MSKGTADITSVLIAVDDLDLDPVAFRVFMRVVRRHAGAGRHACL